MNVVKDILGDAAATMVFIRAGYQTEEQIAEYCAQYPNSSKEAIIASLSGEQAIVAGPDPGATPPPMAPPPPRAPVVLQGGALPKRKGSKIPIILCLVAEAAVFACGFLPGKSLMSWVILAGCILLYLVLRFVIQLKDLPGRKIIVLLDIVGVVAVILFIVFTIGGVLGALGAKANS